MSDLGVVVAATTYIQHQTLTNKHEPSFEAEHFKALPPHDNKIRDWINNPKVGNVVIIEKLSSTINLTRLLIFSIKTITFVTF